MGQRDAAAVDAVMAAWRQGDCVLGDVGFVSRAAPDCPLTAESREAGAELVETEVEGAVVLTQTCDLVRGCLARPYVEVAPLVVLDGDQWHEALRGRRPQRAPIPTLEARGLAADLDRVMTVEKAVVAGWTRVQGCLTDEDGRRFAAALARKRSRFAFPDDFVLLVRPLQDRLVEKHDRSSPEGAALRALREVRVRASPSWDAGKVELLFMFVRNEEPTEVEGRRWDEHLGEWLRRLPARDRFQRVEGIVSTLDGFTARDYVESDALDLGFLSDRPS